MAVQFFTRYVNISISTHTCCIKIWSVVRMTDDVHTLITYRTHQVDKPFIYVGAELGALVARFYANIYEGCVSSYRSVHLCS